MKRTKAIAILAMACGLAIGGNAMAAHGASTGSPAATQYTSNATTAFAGDLLAALEKDSAGKNLFFSPYSISAALAMTAQGAKGNTRDQMIKTLHLSDMNTYRLAMASVQRLNSTGPDDKRPFQFSVANALWVDKTFPLQEDYVAAVKKDFSAEVNAVDFLTGAEAARQQVNAWVETQTHEKIKDLLPAGSVDKATAMVLTNAIYFKGAWMTPFTPSATSDQPFHVDGTHDVTVPLMQGPSGTFLKYLETDDFQAVSLPYRMRAANDRGGAEDGLAPNMISMLVIVPKKVDGLAAVEKQMTAQQLAQWMGALESQPVQVFLPKFKMSSSFELSSPLKAMGMTDAFSSEADFSGISPSANDRLKISAVIHKAYVDVNEQGTEAAAATAVTMMRMAMVQNKAVIRADHPFMFAIYDGATGTVLFMGQVVNPKE